MSTLTLEQASQIIETGLAHAAQLGLKPLTIAVLDAGGHLVALKRQDSSGILRPEIARGKAWGALGMGAGSRLLAQRAQVAPSFVAALASVSDGRLVPVPGGVLIRGADNQVLGAVGVSGDSPENDEACAVRGIEQVGLFAEP